MDDRRAGLVLRQLRRRKGLRQSDVALAAGLSQSTASRAERGHLGPLSLDAVRSLFAAVDARVEMDVHWRGGELDRMLDARHASLVTAAGHVLVTLAWDLLPEVTFSIWGERGSIDLVAVRRDVAAAAVLEMKSELTSWEETQRRFDAKARLAPTILEERLGWKPRSLARILVFEESSTTRRRLDALGAVVQHAYPARGTEIRRWLRTPVGPLAGLWMLSSSHGKTHTRASGTPHRVRRGREG